MPPQAKENLQSPEAGRGKERFSLQDFGESAALPMPGLRLLVPRTVRINFWCYATKFVVTCYSKLMHCPLFLFLHVYYFLLSLLLSIMAHSPVFGTPQFLSSGKRTH